MKKVGIFSGTFDPIHVGHVEACLVAKGALELDEVLVMIEKKPHHKTNVTPYMSRKKMVELALEDFSSINFFETSSNNITFAETTKTLQQHFPGHHFVMIIGSDMLQALQDWPGFEGWITSQSITVVLRDNQQEKVVKERVKKLQKQYAAAQITVLPAVWSGVSSSQIRNILKKSQHSDALHKNVLRYITAHRLYH